MKEKQMVKNTIIEYIRYAIFAIITSFVFVGGYVVDTTDSLDIKDINMLMRLAVVAILVMGLIVSIKQLASRGYFKKISEKIKDVPRLVYLIPLVGWIASWCAMFPGVFSYDCYEEWRMVADSNITSHHPVLHVLTLGGLVEVSNNIFGTGNVGIAIYVLVQLGMYAFVFLRLMSYLKKNGSKISQWIAVLLYTFSPVILMYIIATTKDSIFSIFELWFILSCLRIDKKELNSSKLLLVEFAVSSLFTMILRKNGLYIVVFMLVYMGIRNIKNKKLLLTIAGIVAVYFIYAVPFFAILNVGKTSSAEMLAVPIQQLARVHRFEREAFSNEDLQVMYDIIPEDYWNKYIPSTVDSVKLGFDNEAYKIRRVEFFKVWIRQGIKNPMSYINAFLANTVDLWCPMAVNDGYRWLYGNDETKSDFFDYRVAEPGKEIIVFKPLHNLIEYLSTDMNVTRTVGWSLLLNPGWYILLWLASVFLDKNIGKKVSLHLILALSLLSVLAGPMAMVRYVLIFYLILPIEV